MLATSFILSRLQIRFINSTHCVFRTSSVRGNANLARSVVEENQDVTAMDRLLKVVSEFLPSSCLMLNIQFMHTLGHVGARSNPAYHS
jgi:hypothetical protein